MAGKTDYKNKWLGEHCDRFSLVLPKGRKAEIKAAADAKGQSLNSFINEAIDAHMKSPLEINPAGFSYHATSDH